MPGRCPNDDSSLGASSETRMSTVLDNVRIKLQNAGVVARLTAPSIPDDYNFVSDQADLRYLCELVGEVMDSIAAKLVVASVLSERPVALAISIEKQRWRLRRAQAVVHAMTHLLRVAPQPEQPFLMMAFKDITKTCARAHAALDPVALGLPIPNPDI